MRVAIFYSLVFFILFPFAVDGQLQDMLEEMPEAIKDAETVVKNWKKLENLISSAVSQGTKSLMSTVMDDAQQMNISSTCIRNGIHVLNGIRRLETWAMRFIDSSAKGVDGAIIGAIHSFGSYDECIDTVAINRRAGKEKGKVLFTGQYCLLKLKPTLPPNTKYYKFGETIDELRGVFKSGTILEEIAKYASLIYYSSFRLGLCLPSGCSTHDIHEALKMLYNATGLVGDVKKCAVKEEPTYTPLMIVVIFLYSFAGFLVLVATLIDMYCYYSKRKMSSMPVRILLAFSFLANYRKVVDTSASTHRLGCLNGIRFLSMSWIILGHTYGLSLSQIVTGMVYVKAEIESFAMQPVMRSVVVDTFFFMGGMVLCYTSIGHVVINKEKFSLKLYVVHRLWRILPTYSFVILLIFIAELMTSGPIAHILNDMCIAPCKETFWTNLLFVNNYVRTDKPCLPHGWYLAVDMQLYLASLIILLPLFRYPKVGLTIAVTACVGFMVTSAVIPYLNDSGVTEVLASSEFGPRSVRVLEFYMRPYPHGAGYIIGIITGYFLAMNPKCKIPKLVQVLGWSTAITFSMLIFYGPLEWVRGRDPTTWEVLFYNACMRPAWTLSISWIIISCATGHGGYVNSILSWKNWIPLARLTFTAYLIHPIVQVIIIASFRTLVPAKHFIFVWMYFGHLVVSYGIAFGVTMLIESPSIALEKLLLPQLENKESSTKPLENPDPKFITVSGIVNGKNPDNLDNNSTVLQSYKDVEYKQ